MTPVPKASIASTLFSQASDEGFEEVVFCHDSKTQLRSIISIHSTKLGPALGGCRYFSYPDEDTALLDSLNLARAMTYKASVAGLNLGGGKAVILADPKRDKSPIAWKAFASFVERLGGAYITTVDSGTSPADMDQIRKYTKFVVGMTPEAGGSGDPSPTTALGVLQGIRACLKFVSGSDSLSGRRVAIQGVGNVGYPLARHLSKEGVRLIVADKNRETLERTIKEVKAEVVDLDRIFSVECDVFSPCAMGKAITTENVKALKCSIVAGAANNQLADDSAGNELERRGIAYAPDYAINAGGLIHVASEWEGFNASSVESKTLKIYDTILKILKRGRDQKRPTFVVAHELARERLRA